MHGVYRVCLIYMLSLVSPTAWTMTCNPRTNEEIVKTAGIAFVGRVLSVEDSAYSPRPALCWKATDKAPECGGKLVTLQITRTLRGDVSGTTTVLSEDACYCVGSYWHANDEFIVVANPNPTQYHAKLQATDKCGGTRALSEEKAQELLKAFDAAR